MLSTRRTVDACAARSLDARRDSEVADAAGTSHTSPAPKLPLGRLHAGTSSAMSLP